MGITSVILHLTTLTFSVTFVTCQNVSATHNATSSVAVEGGPITLHSSNKTTHQHMIPTVSNKTSPQDHKHMLTVPAPVDFPPFEVGQKNDNKTSVPKKDAIVPSGSSSSSTSSTTTTTTTTQIPAKPTLTEGEDEPPVLDVQKKITQKSGVGIDALNGKPKRTDYIVPIVAVILSVPIVAIVFSVLYKRGADWWQHRHYRRMDFLIEGMYNN